MRGDRSAPGSSALARATSRYRAPLSIAAFSLFGLALLALRAGMAARTDTERCPAGSTVDGPRCCPIGQRLERSPSTGRTPEVHCVGAATHCPAGLEFTNEQQCVAPSRRIAIAPGRFALGPSDWEAEGVVEPRTIGVTAFWLDSHETTEASWAECARASLCLPRESVEPGQPVRGVAPHAAEAFCAFRGGRLPTEDEWIYAAATPNALRYPWGPTGLVCRRASFGLEDGPCARGATGPELAGMRPDGRSASGLYDLSGNVAEWVRRGDHFAIAGGSYRSQLARQLKSWAIAELASASSDVGVRCAYDQPSHPDAGGSASSTP